MFEKSDWIKSFYKYSEALSKVKHKLESLMNIQYSREL